MKRKPLNLVLTALAMMLLILDSKGAFAYAAEGVDICLRTVIPSLFPFFVLSIYLTGNMGSGSVVRSVLISGFLGGYPVGAQSAAQAFQNGNLSREEANRLLMFCSQPGPSFLFGLVAAQFPHSKYGWLLWAVILLSGLSVNCIIPSRNLNRSVRKINAPTSLSAAMKKATLAMTSVCGWVVLFRVILGFLQRCGLGLLPDWGQVLISGLLELANGSLLLTQITSLPLRFLLASVMLNFGGLCVAMQTASVAEGLNMKGYLFGKLLQTFFSMLYSFVILGHFEALVPVFLLFLLFRRENLRKRGRFPAPVGV